MGIFNRRIAHKSHVDMFSTENLKRRIRQRDPIFTLNYAWIFSSAVSVILGVFITYTSLHYLTAFVSPQQVLRATSSNSAANQLDGNGLGVMDKVITRFATNQAYIRSGRALEAHYIVPDGYDLDVYVQRCKPLLIIEVFKCIPGELQKIDVGGDRMGVERLAFAKSGFYRYRGELSQNGKPVTTLPDQYRLVWKRG